MKKLKNYFKFLFFYILLSNITFSQSIEPGWLNPGHSSGYSKVIFSNDSRYFLIVDNFLRVWDLENRQCFNSIRRESKEYFQAFGFQVLFTSDNRYICLPDSNKISLLDYKTNEIVRQFEGPNNRIRSVKISSDNKFIMGGDDNWIFLWEFDTGKLIKKVETDLNAVYRIEYTHDGKHVIVYGSQNKILVKRLDDLSTVKEFSGSAFINFVSPELDTELIMVEKRSSYTSAVISGYEIYELNSWELINEHSFEDKPDEVFIVDDGSALIADNDSGGKLTKFSLPSFEKIFDFEHYIIHDETNIIIPEENVLVAMLESGGLGLWDISDGSYISSLAEDQGRMKRVIISPDHNHVISCDRDGYYYYWPFDSPGKIEKLTYHNSPVISVSNVSKYNYTVSLDEKGKIIFWEMSTGKKLNILDHSPARILSFDISEDENKLAVYSYQSEYDYAENQEYTDSIKISVYDLESLEKSLVLDLEDELRMFKFVANNVLKIASYDRKIYSWNLITNEVSSDTLLGSVPISPLGNLTYSVNDPTGSVKVYNPAEKSYIINSVFHNGFARTISFSQDRKYLATSGQHDDRLKVWDLSTGKLIRDIKINSRNVRYGRISPSGRYFAGAGDKGVISVWDLESSKIIATENYGMYSFHSLSWSGDEKYITMGSYDGTVMLWKFNKI